MKKRRLLIYMFLPLAMAGTLLYLDAHSEKKVQKSSPARFAPADAVFENAQDAEGAPEKETSTPSEETSTHNADTPAAADTQEGEPLHVEEGPRTTTRQSD